VTDAPRLVTEAIRTQMARTGQASEDDLVTHSISVNRVVSASTGAERIEVVPLTSVDESMQRGMLETAVDQLSSGN